MMNAAHSFLSSPANRVGAQASNDHDRRKSVRRTREDGEPEWMNTKLYTCSSLENLSLELTFEIVERRSNKTVTIRCMRYFNILPTKE
jgi:hypothetical protein